MSGEWLSGNSGGEERKKFWENLKPWHDTCAEASKDLRHEDKLANLKDNRKYFQDTIKILESKNSETYPFENQFSLFFV